MTPTALVLLLLAGCDPDDGESTETEVPDEVEDTAADIDAPVIEHDGVESPQYVGADIYIEAAIRDEDSNVLAAQLLYRRQTAENWNSVGMLSTGVDDLYGGYIPAEALGSAGMHYYLTAVDTENNQGVFPDAAPEEFFAFDLTE